MRKTSTLVIFWALIIIFTFFGCVNNNQTTKKPINITTSPVQYEYDVIVIGAEPEGIAAAIASARNGADTLLIEKRDGLGGLFTYGMLNQLDLGYDKDGNLANQGIFKEWHQIVNNRGAFDIEGAKEAFIHLIGKEKNLTVLLQANVQKVIKNGNQLVGLEVQDQTGLHTYQAKHFIDSTADADIAAMAGVPYFLGQEDIGLKDTRMADTLVLVLKNVDWNRMKMAAENGVLGGAEVYENMAWGFTDVINQYKPIEANTRLRALNIAKQFNNGLVTINALQIFSEDGLSDESRKEAMERGKRESINVLKFLRQELPGFEQAEIALYPPELYIRETRHILAEYQLTINDIWMNRDKWDSIGFGAYPVDLQATSVKGEGGYEKVITRPIQYAIPFRSLVPNEIEGLLVASKAAGYTSLTAGSARTVPIGMTAGQAAGTAAAISIQLHTDFRKMVKDRVPISELQRRLKLQGALLYHFTLSYPFEGEWFDQSIQQLLPYGVIQAGYENDLYVNEPITKIDFIELLSTTIKRSHPELYGQLIEDHQDLINNILQDDVSPYLTRDQMATLLLTIFNHMKVSQSPWEQLMKLKLVDKELEARLSSNREVLRSEGIYMVAFILNRLSNVSSYKVY
ncbi:FAD-dependent oxidoreductase [Tepidibacillus decaturensis]|uniref:Uncharacterized protein n=1 Tax=Tepidibacillus decaturensis TaxID=1413211 RepID=A0A135L6D3_9BACI|nr:FAD-dependent oxidoreductase [Tepidibacillus decaturensis]KXG44520.1 hypothetical protein U473_11200 [Tepidibacillus decaturensis]